jgi:hypothetical protein
MVQAEKPKKGLSTGLPLLYTDRTGLCSMKDYLALRLSEYYLPPILHDK